MARPGRLRHLGREKPPVSLDAHNEHQMENSNRRPLAFVANHKQTFKVISLDRESGKILWQSTAWEGTPYDNRHRKSSYAASTPATDGKLVYAFFGTEGLYAYDFKGNSVWKAELGKLGTVGMGTGTSPILFDNLVIVQCDEENGAASFSTALDRKTGKE